MSKPAFAAAFLVLALALGVSADRAWVANRAGTTIEFFDTATNTLEAGSPLTVGSGAIDMAPDQPDAFGPMQLYVVNSGSNSVTVIRAADKVVTNTIGSGGLWGTFETPSGAALVIDGTYGPAIAVVDQKVTFDSSVSPWTSAQGRSTIRLIDPSTNTVQGDVREASGSARYNDVLFTASNRRLWIADDGDQGVVVVRLHPTATGFPQFPTSNLVYNGGGEYADFITDRSATRTFLLAPRRLATNGTRVVVADGASSTVTVLDANYVADNESGAVLQNVDVTPLVAGDTCVDVEVAGNFAYVTTTGASPAANVHQVDLSTYAVASISVGVAGGATVAGMGATSDGAKLYVGAGASGPAGTTDDLYELDIAPAGDFSTVAPVAFSFGGAFPFAFYSSPINPNSPPSGVVTGGSAQPGAQWTGGIPGSSSGGGAGGSGENDTCGLLGLEFLLLLAAARLLRR